MAGSPSPAAPPKRRRKDARQGAADKAAPPPPLHCSCCFSSFAAVPPTPSASSWLARGFVKGADDRIRQIAQYRARTDLDFGGRRHSGRQRDPARNFIQLVTVEADPNSEIGTSAILWVLLSGIGTDCLDSPG